MALLLRDREATPEAAPHPHDGAVLATVPDFACETCGAAMARGQDWCLECGTAAPGRLGAKPGWRAAFTVVGLTTLLLCCAVVAAYAALTSDAERTASAPPAGSGDPITAQAPGATAPGVAPTVIQPGATGPGVTPPATPPATNTPIIPTTKPPAGTVKPPVIPTPTPPAPASNGAAPQTGATTNNATGSGSGSGSTGSTDSAGSTGSTGATAPAAAGPVTVSFRRDAARTYDPTKRAGAEFGPAAFAIDSKPNTVWDVSVPADGQPIAAGLVLDLGKPYALRTLRLDTPTDGFTVEIYGAKSAKQLPEDVIDKRWIHLTDKKFVLDGEPIVLKGKGDDAKVQLLLLHFTTPAEPDDPRVAIGDVKLRGTL